MRQLYIDPLLASYGFSERSKSLPDGETKRGYTDVAAMRVFSDYHCSSGIFTPSDIDRHGGFEGGSGSSNSSNNSYREGNPKGSASGWGKEDCSGNG